MMPLQFGFHLVNWSMNDVYMYRLISKSLCKCLQMVTITHNAYLSGCALLLAMSAVHTITPSSNSSKSLGLSLRESKKKVTLVVYDLMHCIGLGSKAQSTIATVVASMKVSNPIKCECALVLLLSTWHSCNDSR